VAIISITVALPHDLQSLVRAANLYGQSASEFRAAIESGRPVFEEELYGNREFHEVADEVESLVKMLRFAGVEFSIYESGEQIDPDTLFNILSEGRQQFRPAEL
jgi:hypothetical protein